MPADVTSLTGPGESPNTGLVAFATTHWSVVLAAHGDSAAAQDALEKLCRTYWWPLYGFVRRQGYVPEEAQDLTQGFFTMLLERKDFESARREKGRLRSYLLTALKHFLAKSHRSATALKRGEGKPLIPLDDLLERERADLDPADTLSADKLFERRWALTLLEQALTRLEQEYRAAEKGALFDELKQMLAGESTRPSHAETGQKLGMSETAVRQAAYRFRERCRLLIREEIAQTVAVAEDLEEEVQHFIAVLQA